MKKFLLILTLILCSMFILNGCTPSYRVKYSPESSDISSNETISDFKKSDNSSNEVISDFKKSDNSSIVETGDFYNTTGHLNIYVIIDSKTGVNYIVTELYQNSIQIIPRLNVDGTLYVTK